MEYSPEVLDGVFSVILVEDLHASSLRMLRKDVLECVRNPITQVVTLRRNGEEVKRWSKRSWAAKAIERLSADDGWIIVIVGAKNWGMGHAER